MQGRGFIAPRPTPLVLLAWQLGKLQQRQEKRPHLCTFDASQHIHIHIENGGEISLGMQRKLRGLYG